MRTIGIRHRLTTYNVCIEFGKDCEVEGIDADLLVNDRLSRRKQARRTGKWVVLLQWMRRLSDLFWVGKSTDFLSFLLLGKRMMILVHNSLAVLD